MNGMKIYYISILIFIITCSRTEDPYIVMIDHMLADTTLVNELWCDSCVEITNYSVHPVVNFEWDHICLNQYENSEEIIAYWFANRYKVMPELKQYSTSEISDYHIFFNERFENIQAMFVFYREAKDYSPYYTIDLMYDRPYEVIWRFNTGVMYLFESDEITGNIEFVCRETIHIE
jgi:hypothetical protein